MAPVSPPVDGSKTVPREEKHPAANDDRKHLGGALQPPPGYDGWEIEEQLRHAFRVLGPSPSSPTKKERPASQPKYRIDAGHGIPPTHANHVKRSRRVSRRIDHVDAAAKPASWGDFLVAAFVWMALSLGTMAFGCGLALWGWSAYSHNQDLWAFGVPIVLGGQIALVLGLVLQLDRLWRDSRRATAKLRVVDEQINDLKTTTSLLGTTHAPSAAFYAHWAGGAGPNILLSDLKSQLDLLAVKLAKD